MNENKDLETNWGECTRCEGTLFPQRVIIDETVIRDNHLIKTGRQISAINELECLTCGKTFLVSQDHDYYIN